MTTTNLFVIANVKQLRTGGCFRNSQPFFRTSWGVGVLNSAIFNAFHNWVEVATILEDLWNFGEGGEFETPSVRRCLFGRKPLCQLGKKCSTARSLLVINLFLLLL